MTITKQMKTKAVYIGDPCYCLMDTFYNQFIGAQNSLNLSIDEANGECAAIAGRTYLGDGEYLGSNNIIFGVDSGMIGVVNTNYINEPIDSIIEGMIVKIPSGIANITISNKNGFFDILISDENGNQLQKLYIDTIGSSKEIEDDYDERGIEDD